MKYLVLLVPILLLSACTQYNYEASTLNISNVSIIWLGHASFMIEAEGKTIYIDPYVLPTNPKPANIILVTHEHFDHAGEQQARDIRSNSTILFGSEGAIRKLHFGNPISDSVSFELGDIRISTVKSYNIDKIDDYGKLYHAPGEGNGYIMEINGLRIYHAGDTDFIQEMKNLGHVDVALLPMGGKYTMTVQEATEAARTIKPVIVVPMHYNSQRYGIQGLQASPASMVTDLAGSGITVKVLEPLIK